jgi:hypothetical protein
MNFSINSSIEILERTPATLRSLLHGLSDEWITATEGGDTWSPFDVVGHLLHGEKTDWIERMDIILSDNVDKTFKPFDRFAQFTDSKGKSLSQLLDEFESLRSQNIQYLKSKSLTPADLMRTGTHPVLGTVILANLLSTWVAHDLNHIAQIARIMANRYKTDVGPWREFLRIINTSTK